MRRGDHYQPGPGPIGLASSYGFPWARLITGVFAVSVSLATTWRALIPTELAHSVAPRPQYTPVLPQAPSLATEFVEQQQSEKVQMTPIPQALVPPAAPVQVARRAPRRLAGSTPRHPPHRISARAGAKVHPVKLQGASLSAMKARANPWSMDYDPIAHTQLTRKRSEVRNEYLASREQVAAFTGEDSGSAYLARQATRQTAAPAYPPARANNRGHGSRRETTRS